MRYLTVNEVLEVYGRVMQQSGGSVGIRDLGALESAVAQPRMAPFASAQDMLLASLLPGRERRWDRPTGDGSSRTGLPRRTQSQLE